MTSRLVLIVNIGSLLMDGIGGFLESNSNGEYEVVKTVVSTADALLQEVERVHPSVIVIEDATPFITPPGLLAALPTHGKVRVIVLSSEVSKAEIYDKSEADLYYKFELALSDPAHFVAALNVRSLPFSY
jgi:DNA-binding NarL/FixJ family response regulator